MSLSGVIPAAVTPFCPQGDIDYVSLAKLTAFFHAAGCSGVVVAGTNGEGPSLSAVEKRDLCRRAVALADPLPVILGVSTPSLHEATWLASQAEKAGARALLLMPPGYFRPAPEQGVLDFLKAVADASTCPVIVYNYPNLTGFTLTPDHVADLAQHPNVMGFKDSSGDQKNLRDYRLAAPNATLLVGNETLLPQALAEGWNGTISGVANVLPQWLTQVFENPHDTAKFGILLPLVTHLRKQSQPATNKAILFAWKILSSPAPRLPLMPADPAESLALIAAKLGVTDENLGLP